VSNESADDDSVDTTCFVALGNPDSFPYKHSDASAVWNTQSRAYKPTGGASIGATRSVSVDAAKFSAKHATNGAADPPAEHETLSTANSGAVWKTQHATHRTTNDTTECSAELESDVAAELTAEYAAEQAAK